VKLVREAPRLLLRHWPVLVALAFAGVAGHQLVLRAAVLLAGWNDVPALLVLPVAAGCVLVALALMGRSVRSSLPNPEDQYGWPPLRGMLLPFAVIYFSFGRFRGDVAYVLAGANVDSSLPLPRGTVWWLGVLAAGTGVFWFMVGFLQPRRRSSRLVWAGLRGYFGLSALVFGVGAVVVWAGEPGGRLVLEPVPGSVTRIVWLVLAPAAWLLFAVKVYQRRLLTMPRLGVVPPALFVLAYQLLTLGALWLWELERLALGPQDLRRVWGPAVQLLPVLNASVATMVLVCLACAVAGESLQREPGVVAAAASYPDSAGHSPGWRDEEDERLITRERLVFGGAAGGRQAGTGELHGLWAEDSSRTVL
jgi:hypothetical protein